MIYLCKRVFRLTLQDSIRRYPTIELNSKRTSTGGGVSGIFILNLCVLRVVIIISS